MTWTAIVNIVHYDLRI